MALADGLEPLTTRLLCKNNLHFQIANVDRRLGVSGSVLSSYADSLNPHHMLMGIICPSVQLGLTEVSLPKVAQLNPGKARLTPGPAPEPVL